jgi:hypothetical protein
MEVLLSKISYRLYEMESYCLSYENFPLDSLIEIKEGLDWLKYSISNFPYLTQLEPLLNQVTQFVSCLQQKLSPFSSIYRDLFLEIIEFIRQLVLEQGFYLYDEVQLSTKSERIAQFIERVQQEQLTITQPNQVLNNFEAKLEQDDDVWLGVLMDFIERFSRVGEFTFEGNLNYKADIGSKLDGPLHQMGLSPVLNVNVKTAQSLTWMNRHFNQFQWLSLNQSNNLENKDLRPIFDCLRQAKILFHQQDQKHFLYLSAYQILETVYLTTQADSLGNIVAKLSEKLGFSVLCLPAQSEFFVDSSVVSTLLDAIPSLLSSSSLLNCQVVTLFSQDVSGRSRLVISSDLVDCKPKRYCLDASGNANTASILDIPYELSVLEHKVWLAKSAQGFICVPDKKVHSIFVWDNALRAADLNQCYTSVVVDGVGQIDVFIGSREILDSKTEKNVILINDLGNMYGVLVEAISLDHHVYKVPSVGLSPSINMLWHFEQAGIVAEISPTAFLKSEIKCLVSPKDKPDLKGVGGWIAKIAGRQCFIHPEVVERHLSADKKTVVKLSYVDHLFIELEGRCLPYCDYTIGDALSLLLVSWQDDSVCIAVNSIYYKNNVDDALLGSQCVERLVLNDLFSMSEKANKNVLYVIDSNSF